MVVDLSQGSKQARDQFIDQQQRRAQLRKSALECASKSGRDQQSLLNKASVTIIFHARANIFN